MSVKTKQQEAIELPANIDFDLQQQFLKNVNASLTAGAREILINCANVAQVTSTHINMLWKARSVCEENDCKIRLSEVTDGLRRVLDILDLAPFFSETEPSREIANRPGIPDFFAASPQSMKMEIVLRSGEISKSQRELREFLKALNVTQSCSTELQTLFYETVTNVRLHSGLSSDDVLSLDIKITGNEMQMKFTDGGKPFDPVSVEISYDPAYMMSSHQKRGLGLVMIRRMADRMFYERSEDGKNIVTLEKIWR